jgi:hypothetical protein
MGSEPSVQQTDVSPIGNNVGDSSLIEVNLNPNDTSLVEVVDALDMHTVPAQAKKP